MTATQDQQRITVGGGEAGRRALAHARSRTLFQAVSDCAARFPDKVALVGADEAGTIRRLTYGELVARVRAFSAALAGIGVRRGDRIVLWMTNSLEWIVASFAAMRLGAVVVPVNTFLTPPEVAYVLAQSGARHLVMIDGFRKLSMPAMLEGMCPGFAGARPGFLCDAALPDLRNVIVLDRGRGGHGAAFDYARLEERGGAEAQWQALADDMAREVVPGDLGMIKYTSGSTGFPKGVMLEQGGLVASGVLHARRVGAGSDDVFFSMMPFFHGGGSIWGQMTMLVNGGRLVFTEAFDPQIAVTLLDKEQPTIMFGVLANEVIDEALARGKVFASLRTAHVPHADGRRVMPNVDYNILPFGLTEGYGPCAVSSREDPPSPQPHCGRPLDGYELRVVDPATGRDVAPGEPGEAWLRGNIMRGYWNKPEESACCLTADGWLRSEDIVSVDDAGFVSYVGRFKLMLKVGGENVSIEEVENVIEEHDSIAECGAVGVPDSRKQESVRVYVAPRKGKAIDEAELRGWAASRLARFKQPRDIVVVEQLPRLANGKKDRVALQRLAQEAEAA